MRVRDVRRSPKTWTENARHALALAVVLAQTVAGLVGLYLAAPVAGHSPLELLIVLAQLALVALAAAAGAWWLTHLIRDWWLVPDLVLAERKPWACNICSSFWTSAFAVCGIAAAAHAPHLLLATLPAAGCCLRWLENEAPPPAGKEFGHPPEAAPPAEEAAHG